MLKACVAAAFFASLALGACSTADLAVDCRGLCSRYSDCFDPAYDVGACDARCKAHPAYDTDFRYLADMCNGCITDRVCPSSTFTCASQCGSVVP